jgi:hypothetical protein
MLIPVAYILLYVIGGALRPGYNHIVDSVSELLSPGAPNRPLLIIIDLLYGILHVLFGIGILNYFRSVDNPAVLGKIGAWMIIAVGIAIIGTAIFPQDAVGTPPTIEGKIHLALVFGVLLPFSILSALLIGIWLKRSGVDSGFAVYTFISVAVMVVLGGAGGAMAGGPYMGLGERISALTIHQWLFFFALRLLTI